jgi:hypothetical protein
MNNIDIWHAELDSAYNYPPTKWRSQAQPTFISQSSEDSSIHLYTTLVRPSIVYTGAVWDPYAKNQTMELDSIQRRAARFVNNNFYDREPGSVKAMISDLGWESRTKMSKDQSCINVQDCKQSC